MVPSVSQWNNPEVSFFVFFILSFFVFLFFFQKQASQPVLFKKCHRYQNVTSVWRCDCCCRCALCRWTSLKPPSPWGNRRNRPPSPSPSYTVKTAPRSQTTTHIKTFQNKSLDVLTLVASVLQARHSSCSQRGPTCPYPCPPSRPTATATQRLQATPSRHSPTLVTACEDRRPSKPPRLPPPPPPPLDPTRLLPSICLFLCVSHQRPMVVYSQQRPQASNSPLWFWVLYLFYYYYYD